MSESDRNDFEPPFQTSPLQWPKIVRGVALDMDGLLSFEYETAHFADVGDLRNLKSWLAERKRPVFIVATSNDSTGCPYFFMYKGT